MASTRPAWLQPPNVIHGPEGRNYRLLRLQGEGSHATAFMCEYDGRVHVAKVFHPGKQEAPARVRKYFRGRGFSLEKQAALGETAVMANLIKSKVPLDHLLRIVDWFEDRGRYFIILEYCDGPLDRLIAQPYWNGPRYFCRLAEGLLMGLDALHDAGYVHRDVLPENVFFSNLNRCLEPECFDFKLGDYGYVAHWNYNGNPKSKDIAKDLHAASRVLVKAWYGDNSIFEMVGDQAAIGGLPAPLRKPLDRARLRQLKTDASALELLSELRKALTR